MLTAMLKAAEFAPYQGKGTGEAALLRSLLDAFKSGDIIVADRLYCTYMLIALLLNRDIFICTRCNESRRKRQDDDGYHLRYQGDKQVVWKCPKQRPTWMSQEEYDAMPETLTVRQITFYAERKGYRTEVITIITTLTDTKKYSTEDIGKLYFTRWNVELDIRNLKQTLKMEHIHCKTPHMVTLDFWMNLLAYNVVRYLMYEAAMSSKPPKKKQKNPLSKQELLRRLSFKTASHYVAMNWIALSDGELNGSRMEAFLEAISQLIVPKQQRPPEPRVVKKRNHKFPFMTKPRNILKQELQEKNNNKENI